jgi:hypothetical protein
VPTDYAQSAHTGSDAQAAEKVKERLELDDSWRAIDIADIMEEQVPNLHAKCTVHILCLYGDTVHLCPYAAYLHIMEEQAKMKHCIEEALLDGMIDEEEVATLMPVLTQTYSTAIQTQYMYCTFDTHCTNVQYRHTNTVYVLYVCVPCKIPHTHTVCILQGGVVVRFGGECKHPRLMYSAG